SNRRGNHHRVDVRAQHLLVAPGDPQARVLRLGSQQARLVEIGQPLDIGAGHLYEVANELRAPVAVTDHSYPDLARKVIQRFLPARCAQQASLANRTTGIVFTKMLRSSFSDRVRMYSRSISTI